MCCFMNNQVLISFEYMSTCDGEQYCYVILLDLKVKIKNDVSIFLYIVISHLYCNMIMTIWFHDIAHRESMAILYQNQH